MSSITDLFGKGAFIEGSPGQAIGAGNLCFTIFGGTGDLTFRKLLPAFYNMAVTGSFDGTIVIIGRRDYTSDQYRDLAKDWIKQFARFPFDEKQFAQLAERIHYFKMDFTDAAEYAALDKFYQELGDFDQHVFYFAVAPRFFSNIVEGLKQIPEAKRGKVIVEKPFGEDLDSARELNSEMTAFFGPDKVYRIDHYLGKEMVRGIQTIRYANPIFGAVWDAEHISSIQISAFEEVGVEKRGGYYDQSGALMDMVQNHLLQVLTIVAMERPADWTPSEMYKGQIEVLNALKAPQNIAEDVVLGQYEGYRSEELVDPNSNTETFAALKLEIDNDRWRGMPFYIRTGKKMAKRETEVAIVFKSPAPEIAPDILLINVQPDEGVKLQFNVKEAGENDVITQAQMDFEQTSQPKNQSNTPEAYERLLEACLRGDRAWFSHWEQIEKSWAYVNDLKAKYARDNVPVYPYPPGSLGPKEADRLLGENQHWVN